MCKCMQVCFRTWIKERVRFMCSVVVSAHGLLLRIWIKERVRFMCSVLVSVRRSVKNEVKYIELCSSITT